MTVNVPPRSQMPQEPPSLHVIKTMPYRSIVRSDCMHQGLPIGSTSLQQSEGSEALRQWTYEKTSNFGFTVLDGPVHTRQQAPSRQCRDPAPMSALEQGGDNIDGR